MTSRGPRALVRFVAVAGLLAAPLAMGAPASQASPVYQSTLVVVGAWDSRVGADGSYYVTGTAPVVDGMPSTPGAYVEPQSNGKGAFLTKYDPTGAKVFQLTFGGRVRGAGNFIAVGDDGSAYVVGTVTQANGFPTTPGALSRDATEPDQLSYLAKFSSDGSRLIYSTLLPGVYNALDVKVDAQGAVVLTGIAYPDLPTTSGAVRSTPPEPNHGAPFVAQVSPDGSHYDWATYLSGGDGTVPTDLDLGPDGEVVVAGSTSDSDFTTTPGAVDIVGTIPDVFISVVGSAGSTLVASARFGGHSTYYDDVHGLSVRDGSVWVTGSTDASDFPTTPGAWFSTVPSDYRRRPVTWAARLPLTLDSFDFSTYLPALGGELHTQPNGDAVLEVWGNPPVGFPRPGDDIVSAFLYLKPDGTLDDAATLPFTPNDFDVDRAGTVYEMTYSSATARTARASSLQRKAVMGRYPHCTITGTRGDDILYGTNGPDVICGRGGNDVIVGKGSYDVLVGGAGDDVLRGGRGVDVLMGGRGHDILNGGDQRDLAVGGSGSDRVQGQSGPDILRGGAGQDLINGGSGRDKCSDPQRGTQFSLCENHPH